MCLSNFDIQPTLNNDDRQPFGSPEHLHSLATNSSPTSPTPFFATTSAEFNLFPRHKRTQSNSHRSPPESEPSLPSIGDIGLDTQPDLTQLRSEAFWELHRSVAESGEGLVRRMRDYESSRSRGVIYSRAKGSLRRSRKRHSLSLRTKRVIGAGDGSEEDDVQIFSGDGSSEVGDYGGARKKRAFSLGMADSESHSPAFVDLDGSERCSSPNTAFFSGPSAYNSDDESMDLINDSPLSTSVIASSPGAPALSHSFTNSTNSSFVSLPPTFFSRSSPPRQHSVGPTSPSSSRSEKAIAALSLAMANGAGGLNDYAALQAMDIPSIIEDSQVGELWH
jgi:hypothetical protein